uniref:ATP synthase subunit e, mitochondrial n=1 Tax=Globodera rostochiensis TaxID=31243 RepID=A0A914HCE5_GLORO
MKVPISPSASLAHSPFPSFLFHSLTLRHSVPFHQLKQKKDDQRRQAQQQGGRLRWRPFEYKKKKNGAVPFWRGTSCTPYYLLRQSMLSRKARDDFLTELGVILQYRACSASSPFGNGQFWSYLVRRIRIVFIDLQHNYDGCISYGFIRLRMLSKYHADIREWEVQKIIHKKTEQKKDALRVLREQNEWIMKITDMNLEEGKSQLGVEHLYDLNYAVKRRNSAKIATSIAGFEVARGRIDHCRGLITQIDHYFYATKLLVRFGGAKDIRFESFIFD